MSSPAVLLSVDISSVILPTHVQPHSQSDMTQPAAVLTWWVSACGGSINKHYLSSITSNRAGLPGEPGERLARITDVVFNNVRISLWQVLVSTVTIFIFITWYLSIEACRNKSYSLDFISSNYTSCKSNNNTTGDRQNNPNTKDTLLLQCPIYQQNICGSTGA